MACSVTYVNYLCNWLNFSTSSITRLLVWMKNMAQNLCFYSKATCLSLKRSDRNKRQKLKFQRSCLKGLSSNCSIIHTVKTNWRIQPHFHALVMKFTLHLHWPKGTRADPWRRGKYKGSFLVTTLVNCEVITHCCTISHTVNWGSVSSCSDMSLKWYKRQKRL